MMSTTATSNDAVLRDLDRFFSRSRQCHAAPFTSQQRVENLAHDLFIVDDEDRGLFHRVQSVLGASRLFQSAGRQRECECETRPLARVTITLDGSPMLLDDTVGHG